MIPVSHNDVKIYQINTEFFELADKGSGDKKIEHIINYHKDKFKNHYTISSKLTKLIIDKVTYSLYVFNAIEQESTWKNFLPKPITEGYDFIVQSTSFVLFAQIENHIFAIIGGKGISAIKRFINHSFGLDLYEKLAEPENDVLYSVMSRGVTGNLTSETITYRNEQKLLDSLQIGRVPNKLNLQLRQELKDSVFDFINFDTNENVYLEVGTSFSLKWKISFEQTHALLLRIVEVLKSKQGNPLSRFERIQDQYFCEQNLKQA
ncbi:DUF6119 family protein [Adhaeribacter terreus]|uniref:DUF6119 family protein n=1 Tax=Adhaeribacter terreus TaxID=529703 RepID=A0ABW0EGD0_9BACT